MSEVLLSVLEVWNSLAMLCLQLPNPDFSPHLNLNLELSVASMRCVERRIRPLCSSSLSFLFGSLEANTKTYLPKAHWEHNSEARWCSGKITTLDSERCTPEHHVGVGVFKKHPVHCRYLITLGSLIDSSFYHTKKIVDHHPIKTKNKTKPLNFLISNS